jgi:outer membrane protein
MFARYFLEASMRYFKSAFFMTISFAVILLFCLGTPVQAQSFPVGVFDLQKALGDSKKGQEAEKKLAAKFDSYKKDLEKKVKELEKRKNELDKLEATLSPDAKDKNAELNKRKMELSRDVAAHYEAEQQAAEEMQKASTEAMTPLIEKTEKIVRDLAKERGFVLVLEISRGGIAYYDGALDITAEITKGLNK